jgi:hypothetical protein
MYPPRPWASTAENNSPTRFRQRSPPRTPLCPGPPPRRSSHVSPKTSSVASRKPPGLSRGAIAAKADALHEELGRATVERRVKELESEARVRALRPPPSRRRFVLLLAAATVTVGIPTAIYVTQLLTPAPPGPAPAPTRSAPLPPSPEELRNIAFDDWAHHRWEACLEHLDAARQADPAGDLAPAIQRIRQDAEYALTAARADGGPPRDKPPLR